MGVNIYIVDTNTWDYVSGWDSCRYAGDREVSVILNRVGHRSFTHHDPRDCVSAERPDNIEEFRTALHNAINHNSARWDRMCDMLAEDELRALYFSY